MANDMDKDIVPSTNPDIIPSPVLNPDWLADRARDEDKFLRQYCLSEAVKLEQANEAFQDPTALADRVLQNAEKFRMYILPPHPPKAADIND